MSNCELPTKSFPSMTKLGEITANGNVDVTLNTVVPLAGRVVFAMIKECLPAGNPVVGSARVKGYVSGAPNVITLASQPLDTSVYHIMAF